MFVNSTDVHTHAGYTFSIAMLHHSLLNVYLLFMLCNALSYARRIKDKNVISQHITLAVFRDSGFSVKWCLR